MELSKKISTHNFYSFIWHAAFLAFAQNFIDVDTVIPAMIIDSGGTAMHIGIMTALMLGGASFSQLFFAPYLSNKQHKKGYLLFGINLRVLSLLGLGFILFYGLSRININPILIIFILISMFSFSGAFANISYTDIIGKSVLQEKRKVFFSAKQILAGIIVLFSVVLAKKVLVSEDYPLNYSYMFFIGATLLIIASLGFWSIKETIPSKLKISGIKDFFGVLRSELKTNKKLGYFLGYINTQGIAISFLPFVVLYGKEIFASQNSDTGSFLQFKVIGIVLISILVLVTSKKIKYKVLLYSTVLLSIAMAGLTLLIDNTESLKYIFVIGGIVFSLYTITMNGVLLEVSTNENRALYTGFAGAGNIIPALFPLLAGTIIKHFGFNVYFILFIIIILCSIYFIRKLDCKR